MHTNNKYITYINEENLEQSQFTTFRFVITIKQLVDTLSVAHYVINIIVFLFLTFATMVLYCTNLLIKKDVWLVVNIQYELP